MLLCLENNVAFLRFQIKKNSVFLIYKVVVTLVGYFALLLVLPYLEKSAEVYIK